MTQTETQQAEPQAPAVEQEQAEPVSEFRQLIAKARADKPQRMTPSDLDLAKRMALMYGRGPKNRNPYPEESEYYLHCLRKYNLDPMQRQICAVWRFDKNAFRPDGSAGDEVMTVQTQIDGYRALAARTGQYAGSDEPVFEYDGTTGDILKCTKTVWRIVKGVRCPFTQPAYWKEYKPAADFMWNKMKHCMIAKCAEALALRTAFPADLGGLYVDAEMEQGDMTPPSDVPPPAPDAPQAPTRTERQQPAQAPALDINAVYGRWYALGVARKASGDPEWADFVENKDRRVASFKAFLAALLGAEVPDPKALTVDELGVIMADMEKNADPRPFDQREAKS